MKSYYRVVPCVTKKRTPYVWEKSNLTEYNLEEKDFCKSELLDIDRLKQIKLDSDSKYIPKDLDDALQGVMVYLPVVSTKVMELINNLTSDIQVIPTEIYSKGVLLSDNYYIINTLQEIDALDKNNSYYTTMGQILPYLCKNEEDRAKILTVVKPVLNIEKIGGLDVFRVKNDKTHLYVSNKFTKHFKKCGYSGWGFEKINLTQNGMLVSSKQEEDTPVKKDGSSKVISTIIPDGLNDIYANYSSDGIYFYVENPVRNHRFLIMVKQKKNENIFYIRNILSYLLDYSNNHSIKKGDVVKIAIEPSITFYGYIDSYLFKRKKYLLFILITKELYENVDKIAKEINLLKGNGCYPYCDFHINSDNNQ